MDDWTKDVEFERLSPMQRLVKKALLNPLANYLPAAWWKQWLAEGESELALANWRDPGGWRSMVISYQGNPEKTWDRLLVKAGTIPMALRNRKRLAARLLARLIERAPDTPAHALCLGAGPGMIISEALKQADKDAHATLVDLSSDAFDFGRKHAEEMGVADRMTFIDGDVREVAPQIKDRVDVVKTIGIFEYITDEQIRGIAEALREVMPPGSAIVFNSISNRHGTDRFFRRVFGLNMIHRSPKEIQELLVPSGFGEFTSHPEPLGIYHVVVGRMGSGTSVTPMPASKQQDHDPGVCGIRQDAHGTQEA
ncbi:MAG: methyltransferase domain-containing protein [Planctomycetes bacterium]|jgi:2-polyprenyl-3-methyl-5-hydroxy-6-metoxy-1,4-benzoquinol methylase|nr:methyltransferase domain-containing protein [Phycisphaerae bacterium]NBB94153.1 methyltransferase domain-containing protein [Planctomycetota bacterium]